MSAFYLCTTLVLLLLGDVLKWVHCQREKDLWTLPIRPGATVDGQPLYYPQSWSLRSRNRGLIDDDLGEWFRMRQKGHFPGGRTLELFIPREVGSRVAAIINALEATIGLLSGVDWREEQRRSKRADDVLTRFLETPQEDAPAVLAPVQKRSTRDLDGMILYSASEVNKPHQNMYDGWNLRKKIQADYKRIFEQLADTPKGTPAEKYLTKSLQKIKRLASRHNIKLETLIPVNEGMREIDEHY